KAARWQAKDRKRRGGWSAGNVKGRTSRQVHMVLVGELGEAFSIQRQQPRLLGGAEGGGHGDRRRSGRLEVTQTSCQPQQPDDSTKRHPARPVPHLRRD